MQHLTRDQAVQALLSGGVVLHPTTGLYGLAADATNAEAVDSIRRLKGLEEGPRPYVVLIEPHWLVDVAHVEALAQAAHRILSRIRAEVWPAPLTVVVPARRGVVDQALLERPGGPTVAVRVEAHPVAADLVAALGRPMVSTSANRTGLAPASRIEDVDPIIASQVGAYLEGPKPRGGASTIIDLAVERPRVLRWGSVGPKELRDLLGLSRDPRTGE